MPVVHPAEVEKKWTRCQEDGVTGMLWDRLIRLEFRTHPETSSLTWTEHGLEAGLENSS